MNLRIGKALRRLLLGAAVVGVSGCASYPVSKNLREQAKPLTLGQVAANPAPYKGSVVIWGGTVIDTMNGTNGGEIYVLGLPLDRDERPQWYGVSTGRFIARRKGFIDPQVFRTGRFVTIAGTVAGTEIQPLQKTRYTYPVLNIDELHLWQARPYYYVYPDWYWGWYGSPAWQWYWHGPEWGWGGYWPGRHYYYGWDMHGDWHPH